MDEDCKGELLDQIKKIIEDKYPHLAVNVIVYDETDETYPFCCMGNLCEVCALEAIASHVIKQGITHANRHKERIVH